MYLDELPDLSRARLVRARSRGVAIRDRDRAVAVAFVSDGSVVPADTVVRFELSRGEDPARRLGDALALTGARNVWFYGGDEAARRAALELELTLAPVGGVYVRRMDARGQPAVVFRPPALRDRRTLEELRRDHAPAFRAPDVEVGEIAGEAVGIVLSEPLDEVWTELRVAIYPAQLGHRYGAALLAAGADRIESEGRRVCAAIESVAGRERDALETAGFRLSDYYFTAARARASVSG